MYQKSTAREREKEEGNIMRKVVLFGKVRTTREVNISSAKITFAAAVHAGAYCGGWLFPVPP